MQTRSLQRCTPQSLREKSDQELQDYIDQFYERGAQIVRQSEELTRIRDTLRITDTVIASLKEQIVRLRREHATPVPTLDGVVFNGKVL